MNKSEKERRQEAEENAESLVVEPIGEVPPSDMKQMLSLRMDSQLIGMLRNIAKERGVTVSELLREAALDIVSRSSVPTYVSYKGSETTAIVSTHSRNGTRIELRTAG